MEISPISVSLSPLRLTGRWLFMARMLWFVVLLLAIVKATLGLPLYFDEKNDVCTASHEICQQGNSLNAEQVQALGSSGISLSTYAWGSLVWKVFTSVIWASIGLAIFLLQPKEWLALIASSMMIVFVSAGYEYQISAAYPSLGIAAELIFNLGNILMFLFIGLFPSGRFSPRWMRWYWLVMVAISILPSSEWIQNSNLANAFIVVFWISFLVLGPFSQIYRYRNESNAVERQQTKLVVLGFAAFAGILLVGSTSMTVLPKNGMALILLDTYLFDIAGLLIPLSIGLSILRYRLWEIDLIIRRTLVYSLLTLTLGLIYLGAVVTLQNLLGSLTGERQSEIVTVISTLAVAALVSPLRRRIQDFVDRRFYRKKYSAEQALAAFALHARNETDLDELTGRLVDVIQETIQPAHASLWLSEGAPKLKTTREY
jgi:hypothetical protein